MNNIARYAKQAMADMEVHHIPPVPENFAVWYTHHAGNTRSLSQKIEEKIEQKQQFDSETNDALYRDYAEQIAQSPAPGHLVHNTQHLLEDALEVITGMIQDADHHNHAIQERLDDIITNKDSHNITTVIEALVAAAKEMKENSQSMQQRLEASHLEIHGLKRDLAEISIEAEQDFLTGVYNRKAMDKQLQLLSEDAVQHASELCLLMIDIDHFKHFNDTYGHLIGDEVLKMIAKILSDSVSSHDVVARFGGEEFAILLPRASMTQAISVAETLCESIANKELIHSQSDTSFGSVTVSIGVASYLGEHDKSEDFIKRADDALYDSKRQGRNCVTGNISTLDFTDPQPNSSFKIL